MNQELAQKNLVVLHQTRKEVAKNLLGFLQKQREEKRVPRFQIQAGNEGKPRLMVNDGEKRRALDSSRVFGDVIQDVRAWSDGTLIVWPCGLGDELKVLGSLLGQVRIVIVEPDWEVFFASLQVMDWEPVLRSERILLLVGEGAERDLIDLVKIHGSLLQENYRLIAGRELLAEEKVNFDSWQRQLDEIAQREMKLSKERSAGKVVIASGWAHGDILPVVAEESREAGYEAREMLRNEELTAFVDTHEAWREALGDPLPEAVLSFTQRVFRPDQWGKLKEHGVKRYVWCYDDPARYQLDKAYFESLDRLYCFDPFHAERMRKECPIPVDYLPAATTYSRGIEGEPPVKVDDALEITFVGSTGIQRYNESYMKLIAQGEAPYGELRGMVESVCGRGERIDYEKLMKHAVPNVNSKPQRVMLLEDMTTFALRVYFLSALHDMPLKIYGDVCWSYESLIGSLRDCFVGRPADFHRETPWIYQQSKINVNLFNVQCVNAPTVRMLDVMACGGFLLTEDRPFLHEMFRVGEELEVFRTREELREKALYYLAHDEKRNKIAQAGHEKVLKEHLYRERMKKVFGNLLIQG